MKNYANLPPIRAFVTIGGYARMEVEIPCICGEPHYAYWSTRRATEQVETRDPVIMRQIIEAAGWAVDTTPYNYLSISLAANSNGGASHMRLYLEHLINDKGNHDASKTFTVVLPTDGSEKQAVARRVVSLVNRLLAEKAVTAHE